MASRKFTIRILACFSLPTFHSLSVPRFTLLSPASLIRLTSPLLTPRRGPVSDRREGSRMERVARQTVTRPSGRRDRGRMWSEGNRRSTERNHTRQLENES